VRAKLRNRAVPLAPDTVTTTAAPPLYAAGRDRYGQRIRLGFGKISALASNAPGWGVGVGHGRDPGGSANFRVTAESDALFGSTAKAIAEGRVSPFAKSGKEKP
jgi:hypothetical protein